MFTGAHSCCPSCLQVVDQTMAMSLHLFVVSRVPHVPEHLPYGVALVLIGMVLVLNCFNRLSNVRGKKNGERRASGLTAGRRTMLSVKDVSIRYVSALQGVNFDILENDFAIIGPANSGKTSFYALSTGWTI